MGSAVEIVYDGFISYRHTPRQSEIARALQQALHRFAKPWYRLRAVRLYRDETNLGVRPDLWSGIQAALDRSRYLLLMASPEAAASPWVEKEVAYWLDTKGADSLLVVLTDGVVVWDAQLGRFDPTATTALPPAALARLTAEPFWIDLGWVRDTGRDVRLDHARFRDAIASLAATLRGTDKDALTGEDLRQRRKAMRLAWGAALVLALLAATSVIGGAFAVRQGEQARREQERATTWADRRLFTISLILAQAVEGNRTFTTVDYNRTDGLTFGMYVGWNQYVGRLGHLLTTMRGADQARFDEIFADGETARAQELLAFLSGPKGGLTQEGINPRFAFDSEEWKDRFRRAGSEVVFQRVQLDLALFDFQNNRHLIERTMPALKSERGIAFMLDVMMAHGTGAARRYYREVPPEAKTESTILESIEQQSVARSPKRFADFVKRRRELFRTTPLLLDDPLSAVDLPQPSWREDLMTWSTRLLQRFRGGDKAGSTAPPPRTSQ